MEGKQITRISEQVYLFDAKGNPEEGICSEYKQVYKGRRNVQTFLKEVVFFGNDSFVATGFLFFFRYIFFKGSDCGHIFIWDKEDGNLVQLLKGDNDVVNGVSPHPYLPILASCGIDSSGKVFECGDKPTFIRTYAEKVSSRNDNYKEEPVMGNSDFFYFKSRQ